MTRISTGVGVDGDPGVLVRRRACACRPTRGRRRGRRTACRPRCPCRRPAPGAPPSCRVAHHGWTFFFCVVGFGGRRCLFLRAARLGRRAPLEHGAGLLDVVEGEGDATRRRARRGRTVTLVVVGGGERCRRRGGRRRRLGTVLTVTWSADRPGEVGRGAQRALEPGARHLEGVAGRRWGRASSRAARDAPGWRRRCASMSTPPGRSTVTRERRRRPCSTSYSSRSELGHEGRDDGSDTFGDALMVAPPLGRRSVVGADGRPVETKGVGQSPRLPSNCERLRTGV